VEPVASSPGSDAFERAVGEPIVVRCGVNKSVVWCQPERMSCTHNRELQIKCGADAGFLQPAVYLTKTTTKTTKFIEAPSFTTAFRSDRTRCSWVDIMNLLVNTQCPTALA
jgi:hypothetical protein